MSRYNPSFFDATYYLQQNADVAANWTGPVEDHFFFYGAAEGRMPAPWFDAQYVRATYPDLAELNAEQLFAHYNEFGYNEGRVTAARFEGFDAARYLADYPDLEPGGITLTSALMHYMVFGEGEGRSAFTSDGDSIVTPGTLMLTVGVDTLVGTGGNDVFVAPLGFNPFTLQVVNTLSDFDNLDGGAGVDVLRAQLVDDVYGLRMASIENVFLGARDTGSIYVDFANVTGVEQLWNADSDADSGLYVYDVQAPVIIGMSNVGADAWYEVDYASGVEVAEQTVVLDRVGAKDDYAELGVYTDDGIETLNLNAAGGVFIELYGDADDVANLNIVGSGALEIDGNGFDDLETLDATGYGGNLDIDVSDSAVLESVVTGAGDDRVVIAAAHFSADVNVLDTVDLGAGSNTLALSDSVFAGVFNNSGWFNSVEINALDFELASNANVGTLEFVDDVDLTANATLTLAGLDGLTTLAFDDFEGSVYDFEIAGAGQTLQITAADDFDMGGLLTVSGVENLSIDADDDLYLYDLNAGDLVNLALSAGDEVYAYLGYEADSDVGSLETLTVTGADAYDDSYHYVEIYAGASALTTVSMTGNWSGLYVEGAAALETVTLTGGSDYWGYDAYLDVFDAESLSTATLSGLEAEVYLDDTPAFETLDLRGIEEYAYVDVEFAAFEGAVTVWIGGSDVDYYANTVTSSREVFRFVGEDIGEIYVEDFEAGVGANRDRLDFSQFVGISSTEDLNVVDNGFDTTITAADGQFEGSIMLIGVVADAELGASFIF